MLYTIYAQFKDAGGNVTTLPSNLSYDLILDTEPPNVAFYVNGETDLYTQSENLSLNIVTPAVTDIAQVQISEDGLFENFEIITISNSIIVELAVTLPLVF